MAKSSTVARTSAAESARGVNQPIGAFFALGATEKGWYAYRPVCSSCIATSAPCACTASVTARCLRASARVVILPANGAARPAALGAMPPVTMSPTPPCARRARYAASSFSWPPSSSPLCIEPMITRLRSTCPERSASGASMCGYGDGASPAASAESARRESARRSDLISK